ncbi:MAG: RidA family protein [Planctomycetaceae bacterium]|nr:RidA family protein [Planctomycetota bacterium]NUN53086.1 RidA family protein [Planctomycetaceae bacterium]
MIKTLINPSTLAQPSGYTHAVRCWPCGRMLFLSGQVGWTAEKKFVSKDILGQFSQALANLQIACKAGGGRMDDIVQMRIYVTDMAGYKKAAKNLGKVWREFFGGYYPSITLLEVKGLYDEGAKVEIEAVAVLPLPHDPDDRQMEAEMPESVRKPVPAPIPAPAKKK